MDDWFRDWWNQEDNEKLLAYFHMYYEPLQNAKTGTKIEFRSESDVDRYQGTEVDVLFLDEATLNTRN